MNFPSSNNQQQDQRDSDSDNPRHGQQGGPAQGCLSSLLNFNAALVTTNIFILCTAVLVFGNMLQLFDPAIFAYSPGNGMWFPGIISHMFTHADYLGPSGFDQLLPMHYLGNMCLLVFLGGSVERTYGRINYVLVFLASGVFAALAQASFEPSSFLIGASGALAGILACFVRHFPHVKLYIWGILPMPAWLLAVLWIGYNIAGTAGVADAGVAFIAHLGGFLAGGVLSFILFAPNSMRSDDPSI